MEMGFSRVDAQEALRASNNDINMATNFLLQHWAWAPQGRAEGEEDWHGTAATGEKNPK